MPITITVLQVLNLLLQHVQQIAIMRVNRSIIAVLHFPNSAT